MFLEMIFGAFNHIKFMFSNLLLTNFKLFQNLKDNQIYDIYIIMEYRFFFLNISILNTLWRNGEIGIFEALYCNCEKSYFLLKIEKYFKSNNYTNKNKYKIGKHKWAILIYYKIYKHSMSCIAQSIEKYLCTD